MKDGRRKTEDGKYEERFDLAIDRAVREMLDVEPPADLRAKVIAQLPASGSRLPAPGFQLPALGFRGFAALTVAAALVVLVVVLARRPAPSAQPPVMAHADDVRLPPPAKTPAIPSAPAERPSSTPPRAGMVAASFADAGTPTTDIEPLKTITPIEVAPIDQTSIAPDPISVRPLNPIAEVQIAPLNSPDRRD